MVIKKKSCYHITFYMKFAQKKIVYLRQHFEETVKPGKNHFRWQNESIFLKNQLYGNFHFDLVRKSRRGLVNASRNRHVLKNDIRVFTSHLL